MARSMSATTSACISASVGRTYGRGGWTLDPRLARQLGVKLGGDGLEPAGLEDLGRGFEAGSLIDFGPLSYEGPVEHERVQMRRDIHARVERVYDAHRSEAQLAPWNSQAPPEQRVGHRVEGDPLEAALERFGLEATGEQRLVQDRRQGDDDVEHE